MNRRQRRALAALRTLGTHLFQAEQDSAAWYVWHPTHYRVRLCLTCRDVWDLMQRGLIKFDPYYPHTRHRLPCPRFPLNT